MSFDEWQTSVTNAQAKGIKIRTWADGYGRWHTLITVPTIGLAAGLPRVAMAAIALELAVRGNAATEAWLDGEEFAVGEVEERARHEDGIRYHYAEVDDHGATADALDRAETMARVTGSTGATHTEERRLPTGELVTDVTATWTR